MRNSSILSVAVTAAFAWLSPAHADYETHPEIRPEVRCGGAPHPADPSDASLVGERIPASFGLASALRQPGNVHRIVFETESGLKEAQLAFRRSADTYTDDVGRPALVMDPSGQTRPMVDADVDLNDPVDPGGVESLHCQRLFWDLPTPYRLGQEAIAAPFHQDRVPRFPNGLVDRLPPIYVYDPGSGAADCPASATGPYSTNPDCGDGIPDGFETIPEGFTAEELARRPLCPANMVPWWEPVLSPQDDDGDGEPDSYEPVRKKFTELTDPFLPVELAGDSMLFAAGQPGTPQEGEVFRLSCRRGSRTSLGPWQLGTDPNVYDRLPEGTVRFESSARMDDDAAEGRICEGSGPEDVCVCGGDLPIDSPLCEGREPGDEVPATGRREWNVATDFYNHFASHHGTCWNPETGLDAGVAGTTGGSFTCNDPDDPWAASDVRRYHPEGEFTDRFGNRYDQGECYAYQHTADGPKDPDGAGGCYAGDEEPACDNEDTTEGQMFRNATQYPGRLYVEIPDGRGVISLEDQLWDCEHHVVAQLPGGTYSTTRDANFRLMKGGLLNPRASESLHGAAPGTPIGGTVGEKIIQYFTEPYTGAAVKPINVEFEVIQDLATTWYPPFTWQPHTIVWHAPFDLAVGLITTHSHHRNVVSFVDVLPVNPIRSESLDSMCGGSGDPNAPAPEHVYTNWEWEDARVCEYWKQKDGPLILRKGQALRTTCYVNNGVTPEAIKHGLVAGSIVQGLRAQGVEIPPDPSTIPAQQIEDLLVRSPVGQQFLYGTHPTDNYRVAYKCSDWPHFTPVFPLMPAPVCNPNPRFDADGDYVDGPYQNEAQCGLDANGEARWCNPAPIIFENIGEDEMCIPVFMFWRLDNLVKDPTTGEIGFDEEAMQDLQEGNLDEVGTPGVIQKSPGDIGDCRECAVVGW